jgi:hypothetical protein
VASVWITTRPTQDGGKRFRVEYRLGGRESKIRYGGSFKTKQLAKIRRDYIAGELVGKRVPDLRHIADEQPGTPTIDVAASRWLTTRIDVAESTKTRNGLEVDRIRRLLGGRKVDDLEPAEVIDFVSALIEEKYARGTIQKTLQTLAMILDQTGANPNPARDKQARLPRAEEEEINPPTAEHVASVYRLLPSKHRLALLFLDWSGARVAAIDLTRVGDYDEPRRRVRLRASTT